MPRNTPYPLFQMTKPKTIKTVLGARGPMEKEDIRKLMVRNTGQDVNVLVAKWHQHDTTSEAWVTPIVTILPETARISGSRVLMRGAAFTAENIKAKKVWTDADGDLTISFAIRGEDLAFDNQAAPNVSSWLEVDRLPSFTAMKADQALSCIHPGFSLK